MEVTMLHELVCTWTDVHLHYDNAEPFVDNNEVNLIFCPVVSAFPH